MAVLNLGAVSNPKFPVGALETKRKIL